MHCSYCYKPLFVQMLSSNRGIHVYTQRAQVDILVEDRPSLLEEVDTGTPVVQVQGARDT